MEIEVLDPKIDLNTLEFDQVCRGCLNNGELKTIDSQIEEIGDILLGDMFVECTSVQITENDGLPNQLCDNCIFQLSQAYLFKKQCQKIDETIRYFIENKFTELETEDETKLVSYDEEDLQAAPDFNDEFDAKEDLTEEVCEEDTISELKLPKEQTKRKNRERNYNCEECGKTFFTASHLKTHRIIHTDERPFSCDICFRSFNSKPNLKRHNMMHTGERPYRCHVCGKGFIQSVTLKEHLRVHTKEAPYKCVDCNRSFKQSGELRRHLKKYHDTGSTKIEPKEGNGELQKDEVKREKFKQNDKTFLCSDCGKSFSSKTLLYIHNRIHTGEKPYSCQSCDKSFSQVSTLKTHMLVHTGEKNYDCSVCLKSFRHRIALKQHLLIHMGIKKFACTYCSKSFTQSSQLGYHLRTHTGEKPYQCDICMKTFALKGNLTVHKRTHTGETPYLCLVCGKGFYESSSLKKHQKTHRDQITVISAT